MPAATRVFRLSASFRNRQGKAQTMQTERIRKDAEIAERDFRIQLERQGFTEIVVTSHDVTKEKRNDT